VGKGKINSELRAHEQNVYTPEILAVNGEILPGERFLEEKVPHGRHFSTFATASDSCAASLVSGAGLTTPTNCAPTTRANVLEGSIAVQRAAL
jgi:hypothetical protein